MYIQEEFNEEYENQIINEEYKIWKKNAPFLYDFVITHELEWPSLTVEWLPKKDKNSSEDYSTHWMIIGTHASPLEKNYLMVASAKLPQEETVMDINEYKQSTKSIVDISQIHDGNRVSIEQYITHDGEINRARYMPQNPNFIFSKTLSGEIHVFDCQKHPKGKKPQNDLANPQIRLLGHSKEGYGLSLNPKKEGHCISGGYDNKICYWDIQKKSENGSVNPIFETEFNKANVEDVCWNPFQPDIFGSVGDDRLICIWDARQSLKQPIQYTQAHTGDIYSLDFNPFNEYLFISGSEDKNIGLWDLRNTTKRLHTFEGHTDSVMKVQWSPYNVAVFGSSSQDRRVHVWDLSKCGTQMKLEDEQDGPPELLFIHGGHRAKVNDFSWNKNDNMVIASVEENNIIQIWQMAAHIYEEDDDEMEEENSKDN